MRRTLPSILVTAGPTREYIDPTRFISNPSSGKMGYLIAEAARKAGCQVLLISGPTNLKPIPVKTIHVISAQDMFRAVQGHFKKFNVLVMAAAVSDYRPKILYSKKIKKGKRIKTLKLIPNPDILSWASKHKKTHLLVGFAAETDQVLANAEKKLVKKKLDMIVANRVGQENAGFESDKIEFSIVDSIDVPRPLSICKKEKLARQIVRIILKKMSTLNF